MESEFNELVCSPEQVQTQVLKEISRPSLFGNKNIPLLDGLVLAVRRDWTEPGQDVTDQVKMSLEFVGEVTNLPEGGTASVTRELVTIHCDGMLQAIAACSRLIEDARRCKRDHMGVWKLF